MRRATPGSLFAVAAGACPGGEEAVTTGTVQVVELVSPAGAAATIDGGVTDWYEQGLPVER